VLLPACDRRVFFLQDDLNLVTKKYRAVQVAIFIHYNISGISYWKNVMMISLLVTYNSARASAVRTSKTCTCEQGEVLGGVGKAIRTQFFLKIGWCNLELPRIPKNYVLRVFSHSCALFSRNNPKGRFWLFFPAAD